MIDQDEEAHLASKSPIHNAANSSNHLGYSFALQKDEYGACEIDDCFVERLFQLPFESITRSSTDDILMLDEGLPPNFSETDIECLVASLDDVVDV